MTTALANRSQQVKVRRRVEEREAVRRVNFFDYEQDFQCPMLAAMGLDTSAIAALTGMSQGQVLYRIKKYEDAVRRTVGGELEPTSRKKYRKGKGEVARALIAVVTGHRSPVRGAIVEKMERKDLYTPRAKGVIK